MSREKETQEDAQRPSEAGKDPEERDPWWGPLFLRLYLWWRRLLGVKDGEE